MSRIIIFRRGLDGQFEHFEQGNNGWNWFLDARPADAPRIDDETVELTFDQYVRDLRANCPFVPGLPGRVGMRGWAVEADPITGRVSVEEGDEIFAEIGKCYVLCCRSIWVPAYVRLVRDIKSHGRDYCRLSFSDYPEVPQREEAEANA